MGIKDQFQIRGRTYHIGVFTAETRNASFLFYVRTQRYVRTHPGTVSHFKTLLMAYLSQVLQILSFNILVPQIVVFYFCSYSNDLFFFLCVPILKLEKFWIIHLIRNKKEISISRSFYGLCSWQQPCGNADEQDLTVPLSHQCRRSVGGSSSTSFCHISENGKAALLRTSRFLASSSAALSQNKLKKFHKSMRAEFAHGQLLQYFPSPFSRIFRYIGLSSAKWLLARKYVKAKFYPKLHPRDPEKGCTGITRAKAGWSLHEHMWCRWCCRRWCPPTRSSHVPGIIES